ncbi:hypothetical protein [Pseudoxanthomonas sp. GM95]|uniref:hypothetical protein n=1 Tax=Pseudoxanthomonas sp. GM95 TaxID=1881043 RepID=UPI001113866F|nr:hypothetical protein [Pseudoxanthomonas sp. GM95]
MSEPGVAAGLSTNELYIELFSAYKPLSDCMRPLIESGRVSAAIAANRLAASPEFSAFRQEAIGILGRSDPSVRAAEGSNTPEEQARLLILGLGSMAAAGDPASQLVNARAIVLAMTQLACVSDGQCVPSQNLQYWKRRSDAADH